jgi:L-seryl-tRNA(Ser) seleniumtransferase
MIERRAIPAVENLLQIPLSTDLIHKYGRTLVLDAIREVLAEIRSQAAGEGGVPENSAILELALSRIQAWLQPTLLPVINATGVILHTNLGRAPLSKSAQLAISQAADSYCTLEFDLGRGARGARSSHAEALLTRFTGAEAALVVNNNAAAVLLALSALASRKRAIISRTQLVEIGGGFRVPDVMAQSGAKLVEVGATNRVHLDDYELALQEPAALVLRAHHSNFKIVGFTSEPPFAELVALAHSHGVMVIDDLGSGALVDTAHFGLAHEPTVQESLLAGADIVCFSGDKLLGGPQAGIILGRRDLLQKIKKHPLGRALRADKLCVAALAATILHYLKNEAESQIPVLQMMAQTPETLRRRAQRWVEELSQGRVINGFSTVGGGSLPEETLPTWLLALPVPQPNHFLARLREQPLPIIGRIENERVVFDPRTVFPEQEPPLLAGIRIALNENK